MADRYFKYKKALSRENHYFDIGIPVFHFLRPRSLSDKHFVNKIIALHPEKLEKFYEYHLEYYFSVEDGRTEEQFLKKVVYVCQNTIQDFKGKAFKSKSYIWDDKTTYEMYAESIERFLEKLRERDQWGIIRSENEMTTKLKEEIKYLKSQINKFKTPENTKITVSAENLETLIDIFIQLRDLELKEKDKMLGTQSEVTWARLVCNNFSLPNYEEINFGNTEKYFYGKRKKHLQKRRFTIKEAK